MPIGSVTRADPTYRRSLFDRTPPSRETVLVDREEFNTESTLDRPVGSSAGLARRVFQTTGRCALTIAGVTLLSTCVKLAFAEVADPQRARYVAPEDVGTLNFLPVTMDDGSRLTLISPRKWADIAEEVTSELTRTHARLTALFGTIPPFRSSVRLMDEKVFYELTGAPGWTNAMFFRGEIIIPLSKSQPIDLENIQRSVKHEYTHAVLSALSKGRIPGWMDEGLAQWTEGEENPALRSTLKHYLHKNEPVPLNLLQGGFTKLDAKMVPAAYAQSLLAMQAMIKAYGLAKITNYLTLLRQDIEKDVAFETAFGIEHERFEEKLSATLKAWATTPKADYAAKNIRASMR